MKDMNYVIMGNMSTCMKALCRHVTKMNHKQTQIFFVSEHARSVHEKRSARDLL